MVMGDGMGPHRGLHTRILFLSTALFSSALLTVIYLHPADKNGLLTSPHFKIQTGFSPPQQLRLFFVLFIKCQNRRQIKRCFKTHRCSELRRDVCFSVLFLDFDFHQHTPPQKDITLRGHNTVLEFQNK